MSTLLPFSLWDSDDTNVEFFAIVPKVAESLISFPFLQSISLSCSD